MNSSRARRQVTSSSFSWRKRRGQRFEGKRRMNQTKRPLVFLFCSTCRRLFVGGRANEDEPSPERCDVLTILLKRRKLVACASISQIYRFLPHFVVLLPCCYCCCCALNREKEKKFVFFSTLIV